MSWKTSPRLRPTVWDWAVVLAVLALAAGCAVLTWGGGGEEALTAVVTVDGAEVDRFALPELLESPRTYSANGYTLEVVCFVEASPMDHAASSGKMGVCVARSDCPSQDCVRTGAISRGGQSIVCLPARFILRLEGGTADESGVDAVLG